MDRENRSASRVSKEMLHMLLTQKDPRPEALPPQAGLPGTA